VPRRPKPPRRRQRGAGSISISAADGTIRARLPASIDKHRTAKEFRPGQLAEAQAWIDSHLHPQPAPAPESVTVEQWASHWLATYVLPIRPPGTVKWARYALRQLEGVYSVPLVDLRPSGLQALVGPLADRLSPNSVPLVVGVWRRCLEAAVDDELISRNPARRLVLPGTAPRPEARHVTAAEVAALWPLIRGHRMEGGLALALGCGLRIGEILGLAWESETERGVNLLKRTAYIGPQYTNGFWRPHPKSRRPRTIQLPARVVSALIRHKNAHPGTVLVMQREGGHLGKRRPKRPGDRPDGLVPWSAAIVGRDLGLLCEAAGIEHATVHAGRRGLSSALLDGRVPPSSVAERLGHTNAATTLKYYSQPSDEGRAQADDAVAAYLGDEPAGTEAAC
jgi:integrase